MATTNIVTVNMRAEFNLENVDLQEIMTAIEEIKEAVTNYGKLEELSVTSLLPLKADLHF